MNNITNKDEILTTRIAYIDNIRIYLTCLVILHHVSITFGGEGGMSIYQADFGFAPDLLEVIVLTLFCALNQAYFMAFFFLLAGYFTVSAYNKKGPVKFLRDRLIRLGIPLIIYSVFIAPFVGFITQNVAYGQNVPYLNFFMYTFERGDILIGIGHLWFVLALLIFSIFYTIYRISMDSLGWHPKVLYQNTFPQNRVIMTTILVLTGITFFVRLEYAVGEVFYYFQLGHFTQYVFAFCIGLLASNGRWFDHLSDSQAKQWTLVATGTIIILPVILFLLADFSLVDPFAPFMGGFTIHSLIAVLWESVAFLAISITLLHFFQKNLNRPNPWAANAYTAYIIHILVITILIIPLLGLALPAFLKFLIVSILAIPIIFGSSSMIRKLPLMSKVLG